MATSKKGTKKTNSSGISAPWYIFADKLVKLFENDESVNIAIPKKCEESDVFEIVISSDNAIKLAAIKKLIGESREYGNVKVAITYETEDAPMTAVDVATAFADTGYFEKIVSAVTPSGSEMDYIIMSKDVLQFYADNTRDYYGNINIVVATAIEEVIQDSVKVANVAICTKADKDSE